MRAILTVSLTSVQGKVTRQCRRIGESNLGLNRLDYIREFSCPDAMHGTLIRAAFPWGKRAAIVRRYPVFVVLSCVQCFRLSVIHRTLTWTTGSLTCVRTFLCVRIIMNNEEL